MKYPFFFFSIFLFQLFLPGIVSGQVRLEEESNNQALLSLGNRQSYYMKELDAKAGIYTGKAYNPDRRLTEGHPFYKENGWSKGSVVYGGIYYEDIPVLFDLAKDEIIILNHDGKLSISLNAEEVDRFSLLNHTFIRLPYISIKGRDMVPGFYDLLYDGEAKVLVKRTKSIKEDISSGTFKRFPEQDNRLYIKKGDIFYNVKSKGSVLRVFKDKKRELRRFLKDIDIQFHKDKELAAVAMAKYYDTLNEEL